MKATRFVCLALAVACAASIWIAAEDAEEITWKGSYVWARDDRDIPGEIEAVFSPSGDDTWNVVFNFEWEGEMRAWKGTATGSLKSGELEGEATEDRDRKRTFVFMGSVADGVFTGEHGALRDGELNKLGTITFNAP